MIDVFYNKFRNKFSMKKKKHKLKYGQITLDILELITQVFEDLTDIFIDQEEARRKLKSYDFASVRLFEYLKNLKNSGYVEIKEKKDKNKNKLLSIKLTNKGRLKLLENSDERKIDGKWRMISFDIPEKFRSKRNSFRCTIKRIGFRQVQKSLWACPFVKADQIELAIKNYNLDKYVAYLVISKTDIESHLKLLFRDVLKPKKKYTPRT